MLFKPRSSQRDESDEHNIWHSSHPITSQHRVYKYARIPALSSSPSFRAPAGSRDGGPLLCPNPRPRVPIPAVPRAVPTWELSVTLQDWKIESALVCS